MLLNKDGDLLVLRFLFKELEKIMTIFPMSDQAFGQEGSRGSISPDVPFCRLSATAKSANRKALLPVAKYLER